MAGKLMRAYLEEMKDMEICEPVVSVKSVMKEADVQNMETLADALLAGESLPGDIQKTGGLCYEVSVLQSGEYKSH